MLRSVLVGRRVSVNTGEYVRTRVAVRNVRAVSMLYIEIGDELGVHNSWLKWEQGRRIRIEGGGGQCGSH